MSRKPHLRAIDEILALANAIRAARNLNFGKLDRQLTIGIVEENRYLGQPERLARLVPGENHVLQRSPAQTLARRFPEHPAKRVHEIRFARTVGTDDCRYPVAELQCRRFRERLESERPNRRSFIGRPRFASASARYGEQRRSAAACWAAFFEPPSPLPKILPLTLTRDLKAGSLRSAAARLAIDGSRRKMLLRVMLKSRLRIQNCFRRVVEQLDVLRR